MEVNRKSLETHSTINKQTRYHLNNTAVEKKVLRDTKFHNEKVTTN